MGKVPERRKSDDSESAGRNRSIGLPKPKTSRTTLTISKQIKKGSATGSVLRSRKMKQFHKALVADLIGKNIEKPIPGMSFAEAGKNMTPDQADVLAQWDSCVGEFKHQRAREGVPKIRSRLSQRRIQQGTGKAIRCRQGNGVRGRYEKDRMEAYIQEHLDAEGIPRKEDISAEDMAALEVGFSEEYQPLKADDPRTRHEICGVRENTLRQGRIPRDFGQRYTCPNLQRPRH